MCSDFADFHLWIHRPEGKSPIVTPDQVAQQTARLPDQVKEDIQYQYDQITRFAQHQMDSLHSFEVELSPGLITGQRIIPVTTAGCYVPGQSLASHTIALYCSLYIDMTAVL